MFERRQNRSWIWIVIGALLGACALFCVAMIFMRHIKNHADKTLHRRAKKNDVETKEAFV